MVVQKNLFISMIQKNKDCQFGKDHKFEDIQGYYGFRKLVPICSYDYLQPYIDKAFHGESNQLTKEPPVFYATTSGTTGKPKYIPVTAENKKSKAHLLQSEHLVKGTKNHY
jgi:acyl-coenzyme A synthetase/AMP-(fatty) acid ligase